MKLKVGIPLIFLLVFFISCERKGYDYQSTGVIVGADMRACA